MTARIIDGKLVAEKVKAEVKAGVAEFTRAYGVKPGLATVLVGEQTASKIYVKNKITTTTACGMISFHHDLPITATEDGLIKLVHELNADARVHGILVQLPLPLHINTKKVLESILPSKDVDGFHPYNVGALATTMTHLPPCTPSGVMRLLEHEGISLRGKNAVVVGRSRVVGRPMGMLLLKANATVTFTHRHTTDLPEHLKRADIAVVAIGKPRYIQGGWLKRGATVIDVGINRLADGTLCGDVDFASALKRVGAISPVPGGVGPMTIAMLMRNTLTAARGLAG